jgi:hypothetical protein
MVAGKFLPVLLHSKAETGCRCGLGRIEIGIRLRFSGRCRMKQGSAGGSKKDFQQSGKPLQWEKGFTRQAPGSNGFQRQSEQLLLM